MHTTTRDIRDTVEDLEFITRKYLMTTSSPRKREWRTYEQRLSRRIRTAVTELTPLIREAVESIEIIRCEKRGRKPSIDLETKVKILLVKHLLGMSNRGMANMMFLFSFFTSVEMSYKSVERLYSDPLVRMALHNLHMIILRTTGIHEIDATGDATGYTLTIKEHYASHVQRYKDRSKESSGVSKFVYSFKLMDLRSNLYIAYGVGIRSEKEAYCSAMRFLASMNSSLRFRSLRLDRYYSTQSTVEELERLFGSDIRIYILPKKNSTMRGCKKWQESMEMFVHDTINYLKEYFSRVQSESAFSQDKRRFGWKIRLKREERIDTHDLCTMLWHNLLWMAQ